MHETEGVTGAPGQPPLLSAAGFYDDVLRPIGLARQLALRYIDPSYPMQRITSVEVQPAHVDLHFLVCCMYACRSCKHVSHLRKLIVLIWT